MDELADSARLVNDADALRRRLADDGYLFFRGLLPVGQVQEAGHAVVAQLRAGGWIDDRGIPSIQPQATSAGSSPGRPRPSSSWGRPGRPPEMFSRRFRHEPWWEPVPAGLTLHPRAQMITAPPGPSYLIPVHPAWQHWQPPPPATVH